MKRKHILCSLLAATLLLNNLHVLGVEPNQSTIDSKTTTSDSAGTALPDAGMNLVSENDHLRLYVNQSTAEIAVEDKKTGKVFLSNPQDIDAHSEISKDSIAEMKSQVTLQYYNTAQTLFTYTSYEDAVGLEQCKITAIKNGARVKMTLGEQKQQQLLPTMVIKERFQENILNKIEDESKRSRIEAYYRLLERDKLDSSKISTYEAQYPAFKEHDLYVIRSISDYEKNFIEKTLTAAGYTFDDLREDNALVGLEQDDVVAPVFEITIDYRLEEDSLMVEIPENGIVYDSESFILNKINLLEYFGAATAESDGYLFVPDGSGALIRYEKADANTKRTVLSGKIYGADEVINNDSVAEKRKSYNLPVFGVTADDMALFGIVENGDAMTSVTACIPNVSNPYARIYPELTNQQGDNTDESVVKFNLEPYKGGYAVRYFFLCGDDADYVGMANIYREYLKEQGKLKALQDTELPLYLENLGTIKADRKVFGVYMNVSVPLTTYENSIEMLDRIREQGINNVTLRYLGWMNGGAVNTAPYHLKPERKMGSKKELNNLISYLSEKDIPFYPDVDFVHVGQDTWFDGFTLANNSAKKLDRSNALSAPLSTVTLEKNMDLASYILSPASLQRFVDKFQTNYATYSNNRLSIGSLGEYLNSDYSEDAVVNRQQAKVYSENAIASLAKNCELMTDNGFAYTFGYVSDILNMPMTSSEYHIESESIPFVQMVLHGYLHYAGSPINLETDSNLAMLKALETGSGLYFSLSKQNLDALQKTVYEKYTSVDFEYWFNDMVAMYQEVSGVLQDTYQLEITDYQQVANQVFATTYGNCKTVYVNYNKFDVAVDGKTIPAQSYFVQELRSTATN